MLDLLRLVAAGFIAGRAVRAPTATRMALLAVVCTVVGLLLEAGRLAAGDAAGTASSQHAFGMIFLGPSWLPLRGWPPAAIARVCLRGGGTIASALAFATALRQSARLRPEGEEARRLDALAHPLLGLLLLDGVFFILMIVARVIVGPI
jgi:hypothetical protein